MAPKRATKNCAGSSTPVKTTLLKVKQARRDKPLTPFPSLAAEGLTYDRIENDGNCLFRALSLQAFGDQERFEEVRAKVIQFIKDNRVDYEHLVGDELSRGKFSRACKQHWRTPAGRDPTPAKKPLSSFEQYIEVMATNGVWGGEIEVSAFARAYDIELRLYQERKNRLDYNVSEGKVRKILMIFLQGQSHYVSVKRDPAVAISSTSIKAMPSNLAVDTNLTTTTTISTSSSPSISNISSPAVISPDTPITAVTSPAADPPSSLAQQDSGSDDESLAKLKTASGFKRRLDDIQTEQENEEEARTRRIKRRTISWVKRHVVVDSDDD